MNLNRDITPRKIIKDVYWLAQKAKDCEPHYCILHKRYVIWYVYPNVVFLYSFFNRKIFVNLEIFKDSPTNSINIEDWTPYLLEVFKDINNLLQQQCTRVMSLYEGEYNIQQLNISEESLGHLISGTDPNVLERKGEVTSNMGNSLILIKSSDDSNHELNDLIWKTSGCGFANANLDGTPFFSPVCKLFFVFRF